MNTSIFNSCCYTLGWFWVVLLGIAGYTFGAVLGSLSFVVLQLYYSKKTDLKNYIIDFFLVLACTFFGWIQEVGLIELGVIRYTHQSAHFPPLWIVSLYPLFALVLNHSLKIALTNSWTALLFGLLAPVSYIGGQSLGGLTLDYSWITAWLIIGCSWGIYLCLMRKMRESIDKAAIETLQETTSAYSLKLLYDGDCPLCDREICYLKNKPRLKNIEFVNIALPSYQPEAQLNINYWTAMKHIHAIKDNQVLTGIPAFAAVYARCHLLLLSTFFRLPLFMRLLNGLYKLFAKYRLQITGRNSSRSS